MAGPPFLVEANALLAAAQDYIISSDSGLVADTSQDLCKVCFISAAATKLPTIFEVALQTCRRLSSLQKWNVLHLSETDTLRAIQLCIGEVRKQECGEFSVQASDVLAVHRRLVNNALYDRAPRFESSQRDPAADETSSDQLTADVTSSDQLKADVMSSDHLKADADAHCRYLRDSRLVDSAGVLTMLRRLVANGKYSAPASPTLIVGWPCSALEREMAAVLFGARVVLVRAAESGDGMDHADSVWHCVNVRPPPEQPSRTGQHLTGMLVSLLRLLVNTRDELALATVCQMPGLEVSAADFLAIRRAARSADAPMYQTAVSHVRRSDLGRGAPELESNMDAMRRLVTVLQKLQDVIEEETDAKLCCLRLVSVAKSCLLSGGSSSIRAAQAGEAVQLLRQTVLDVCDRYLTEKDPAVIGGHAVKVVRDVVDRISCSSAPVTDHVSILDDAVCTPGTPGRPQLRLPSIVSLFRSPVQFEPEDCEAADKSLRDRVDKHGGPHAAATPTSTRCAAAAVPGWLPAGQTPPEGCAPPGVEQGPTPELVAGPTLVCSRSGSRPESQQPNYEPGAGLRAYRQLQAADRAKLKESQLLSPKTAKAANKQPKRALFHGSNSAKKRKSGVGPDKGAPALPFDVSADRSVSSNVSSGLKDNVEPTAKPAKKRKTEASDDQENVSAEVKKAPVKKAAKPKQIKQVAGQKSIRDFFRL